MGLQIDERLLNSKNPIKKKCAALIRVDENNVVCESCKVIHIGDMKINILNQLEPNKIEQ